MKDFIKRLIIWIKGSADNAPGGASSKKLSAFWGLVFLVTPMVWTWNIWSAINGDWTYLPYVLDATLLFVLGCLGVNAWEKKQGIANQTPSQNG